MQHFLRRIACLLLALLSLLSVAISAEQPRAQFVPVTPPVAAEGAAPPLWVVSDDDTTIYLFGTIHALSPGIDWFNGPVARAFDTSQELVTEIAGPDPVAIQQFVMGRALLPKGQSLRQIMTAGQREIYEKDLAGLGLRPSEFDSFEPWFAAIGLARQSMIHAGYVPANGVEPFLEARAKATAKPHSGLETVEFQLALFDSLPEDVQKRYFLEVVDQLPSVGKVLGQTVTAWRKGDAEALARLVNADEDDPALIEIFLLNRNRNWAGWIKHRLDRPGTVFLAVGAGHLAGTGSLQDQLAAQGVKTQRVQ